MVLSGSIAFGDVLPAWMYHAQVPPPDHTFNPAIPGITWVDLVFPFFLFSMGAAIPLSLQTKLETGTSPVAVFALAARRFLLLAFFALFTQHLKAWVLADQPGWREHLLSLLAFLLLFFQFYAYRGERYKILFMGFRWASFVAAIFLLAFLRFRDGKAFDFYKSDIIILVLANMAFFGTILYALTRNRPWLRVGLLPFVMAVFLAAKEPEGGWARDLFEWDRIGDLKIDWLYKFYFLKYLFIIIPGTLVGELLLKHARPLSSVSHTAQRNRSLLALVAIVLIVWNLWGLFTRQLFLNAAGALLLCVIARYLVRREGSLFLTRLTEAGSYLLLLGLFFDAYEGGIRKDPSTYSYYFVTGGLACYLLLFFHQIARHPAGAGVVRYFALNGKNPLVAYVTGNLLLMPLLSLTALKPYWDAMKQNAFQGLMKGVLFTALVSLITLFFVKRKWFWKS